jgi:hypothetical protein
MKPTNLQKYRNAGVTTILEVQIIEIIAYYQSQIAVGPRTLEVADCAWCPLNTAYSALRRLCSLSLVEQRNTRPRPSEWILTQKGRDLIWE